MRRDAGTVAGQVRRDAGRTRFRCVSGAKYAARQCFWVHPGGKGTRRDSVFGCVPEAKGRGAIVFLGASLEQADAIQLNEQCVGTQRNRRISTCGRRSAEEKLRLVADRRRQNCVPVLRCSLDCIFLFIRCSGLAL